MIIRWGSCLTTGYRLLERGAGAWLLAAEARLLGHATLPGHGPGALRRVRQDQTRVARGLAPTCCAEQHRCHLLQSGRHHIAARIVTWLSPACCHVGVLREEGIVTLVVAIGLAQFVLGHRRVPRCSPTLDDHVLVLGLGRALTCSICCASESTSLRCHSERPVAGHGFVCCCGEGAPAWTAWSPLLLLRCRLLLHGVSYRVLSSLNTIWDALRGAEIARAQAGVVIGAACGVGNHVHGEAGRSRREAHRVLLANLANRLSGVLWRWLRD